MEIQQSAWKQVKVPLVFDCVLFLSRGRGLKLFRQVKTKEERQ